MTKIESNVHIVVAISDSSTHALSRSLVRSIAALRSANPSGCVTILDSYILYEAMKPVKVVT